MKKLFTIALVLIALVGLMGCSQEQETESVEVASVEVTPVETQEVVQDSDVYDLTIQTVQGETLNLRNDVLSQDKGMVVYFMASWCTTCARNWDALSAVSAEFDNVELITVSIDPSDSNELLATMLDENDLTFTTVQGGSSLPQLFNVFRQTTHVVVDSNGEILSKSSGVLSEAEWREVFASAQA